MTVTPFTVESTGIDGLAVLRAKEIDDDRGVVREWYRESAFVDAGLSSLGTILQVNLTETRRGALRGMHAEDMTKLVGVAAGEAFGAYVDLRGESPTHGAVVTVTLVPGVQVLVPAGVGNGFQAVAEGVTQYLYCFDQEWQPGMSGSAITPLDPDLGVVWPIPVDPTDRSQISLKDLDAPRLADVSGS